MSPQTDDLMDEFTDAVHDAINNAEGWPKVTHLRRALQDHGLRVERASEPDLLAALQSLRKASAELYRVARVVRRDVEDAIKSADAAIAKAEGLS